jgi:hypothetical protein
MHFEVPIPQDEQFSELQKRSTTPIFSSGYLIVAEGRPALRVKDFDLQTRSTRPPLLFLPGKATAPSGLRQFKGEGATVN